MSQLDDDIGDRGVHMKIEMPIEVIEISDQLQVQFDLRATLGLQLFRNAGGEKIFHPAQHRVVAEAAKRVDHWRDLGGGQHATPHTHDEMQTDIEGGIFFRERRGLVASRLSYHQAGAGQDPFAMRANDAGVDLARISEVIAIDDQPLHGREISI